MRKVVLTKKEQFEHEKVKRFVDSPGSNIRNLCASLNSSERTASRKIAGYKEHGKAFFVHGNMNKPSSKAISNGKTPASSSSGNIAINRKAPVLKQISSDFSIPGSNLSIKEYKVDYTNYPEAKTFSTYRNVDGRQEILLNKVDIANGVIAQYSDNDSVILELFDAQGNSLTGRIEFKF